MSTGKYFRMELKRCLQSPDIYAGIAGAAAMWLYSTQGLTLGSVLNCFMITAQSAGTILVFMLCVLGHGISFCEDLENKYYYYQAIRGSLKRYIIEKIHCNIYKFCPCLFSKSGNFCVDDPYKVPVVFTGRCSICGYGTSQYLRFFAGQRIPIVILFSYRIANRASGWCTGTAGCLSVHIFKQPDFYGYGASTYLATVPPDSERLCTCS